MTEEKVSRTLLGVVLIALLPAAVMMTGQRRK